MDGIVSITGRHDPELLTGWLHDLDGVWVTHPGQDRTEIRGLGVTLELDTTAAGSHEPTWWAASVCRRAARRAAHADATASGHLSLVLRDGTWSDADAADEPYDIDGVLLFKPGAPVAHEALVEVDERLAECGYRASSARIVSNEEIRRERLGARHHGAYADLAERGCMTPANRAAFLLAFDTKEFRRRFGTTPHGLPVYSALEAIEQTGLPGKLLNELNADATLRYGVDSSAPEGPSKIGECLFAQVVQHPDYVGGLPFVVLNPHMPRVLEEFDRGSALAVCLRATSRTPLPWPRLRKEFCGATDPARALPGSVRGDALAGLLPLRGSGGAPVERTSNGVHLSNGAFEGARDLWNWFGTAPKRTRSGRRFLENGVPIQDLLEHSFIELEGQRRAVSEATDGCGIDQAVAILAGARPLSREQL